MEEPEAKVVQHKDGSESITLPKNKRQRNQILGTLLETDEVLREHVGGFANFLREYAVVGLAVGFIVGQQANSVVKQLVDSFVNPWVQVLFGQSLSSRTAILHHGTEPVGLPWGAFVYALIQFFFVLIAIYAVIKVFRLDRLQAKKKAQK